jgi:hypothetical protein
VKFFRTGSDFPIGNVDWKEFILSNFPEARNVFLSTGAEILAPDYRMFKNPFMQDLMEQEVLLVETTSSY